MKTLHLSIILILIVVIVLVVIIEFLITHNEYTMIFSSKELVVDGLNDTYNVGEPINFRIKFNELIGDCTQLHVVVKNQTDQTIWESKEFAIPCSTNTTLHHGEGELEFGNPNLGYLRINQTGTYYIHIWFAKEITEKITILSTDNTENYTAAQNVTTVIIPQGAEDPSSGKNYEPQFLHLVIGVNNTVKWINVGLASSSVFADNHDDPDFYNVTNISSVAYEYHIKSQNFLMPGGSFEYTFNKVGYFGYHSEPHPWMRGWVLVLPQDAENLTQTVVLNDTNVMGPCEIFEMPCPNTNIFTAQKLGTNIYIEKGTANGVDSYAIVHPENYCVYPPNGYRNPCTNSVDLAILRLVGVG